MSAMGTLPRCRTKIVATIGPASESPEMLARLIRAGMGIARLNFSHGDFEGHAERIRRIREAERATGRRVSVLADLPGPKLRLGRIEPDPLPLAPGDTFTLTRQSTTFERLPEVVKPGDRLFLNDGLVQLDVAEVKGENVRCVVVVGGELRSRKGLNLPGIDLGIDAFTERDRECLAFALEQGVDAVSQSFVERAADVEAVRAAAATLGRRPFVVAKIERAGAVDRIDEILASADGIMVARGDLGVEVPIEEIALLQKELIRRARRAGKPVITATQMLESMTASRLPTRAEATDVANAVLDGTDALMLSAESATGAWPEEAVAMLARIAAFTESRRDTAPVGPSGVDPRPTTPAQATASIVEHALVTVPTAAVFVSVRSGETARRISGFRPPSWIVAPSQDEGLCRRLAFSWGVEPVHLDGPNRDWGDFARRWLAEHGVRGAVAMIVTGPGAGSPGAEYQLQFLRAAP